MISKTAAKASAAPSLIDCLMSRSGIQIISIIWLTYAKRIVGAAIDNSLISKTAEYRLASFRSALSHSKLLLISNSTKSRFNEAPTVVR